MLTAEYLAASPRRRWLTRTVLIVLLVLAATAGYAYLIEPNRLQVTRHRMTGPVREPLKIAHITDLHTRVSDPGSRRWCLWSGSRSRI